MNLERQSFDIDEPQAGPSWAPKNWPQIDSDDLTAGLDPQQMQVAVKAAAGFDPRDDADPDLSGARASGRQSRSAGLSTRELPADLTPEYHGFVGADQDRPVYIGGGDWGWRKQRSARSSRSCAPIIAAMSAWNICTSPT
jgi:2-oxoglutarate dehydrogenase E1 component